MADSAISWKKIYGLNRNLIEPVANRYFFVDNPKLIEIEGYADGDLIVERPLHADYPDRGNRLLPFNGTVFISGDDIEDGVLRLMDAVNINISENTFAYDSTSFEKARDLKAKIIQWVPAGDNVNVSIVMDDASVRKGLGESALNDLEVGDIVQFERIGFARLDEITDDELIFYFAHK